MGFGAPVIIKEDQSANRFSSLTGVSHARNDPNSFDEKLLQELINQTPHVLPIHEYLPSTNNVFSLSRETTIDLGGNQGRIDNLLVTNDGYLVVVETKLYRNPSSIREVITQTLQYGMAITQMPMMELEGRIRQSQSSALNRDERISECVARQAAERNCSESLLENFEEMLEAHLRRGEILLLIVADSIRLGVERVTHWINEQSNSAPYKFGLVELKFYTHGDERVVIPRTVLKTKEVSRHVIVVDIRPQAGTEASTTVLDDYQNTSGGWVQETRAVKSSSLPLQKGQLLQRASIEDRAVITELIDSLERCGFDQRSTTTYLQFGFTYPTNNGTFHALTYLGTDSLWTQVLKPMRDNMVDEELRTFRLAANEFGVFYRPDQINKTHSTGSAVKYQQIRFRVLDFVSFLDRFRTKFIDLLHANQT